MVDELTAIEALAGNAAYVRGQFTSQHGVGRGAMVTYILVSIAGGVIFIVLDFILNVNPLARRLSEPYKPISRARMRMAAPVLIDLFYGLAMAGIFLLLRPALPGGPVVGAGISFGLLMWFFRVLMSALSQWVMFEIPWTTVLYSVAGGLVEMLILGLFYGVAFKSFP